MTNIVVPELGESVVEARVARWLKKEGDRVEVGEPLVELETEKIDLEVNADKGGVLASIKRQEGEDVKIGELLAVVDEAAAPRPATAQASARDQRAGSDRRQRPAPEPPPPADADQRATPTAKRIASEHDVDLGSRPRIRLGRTRDEAGRRRPCIGPPTGAAPGAKHRAAATAPTASRSVRPQRASASGCRSVARRSPVAWSRLSTTPRC